MIRLDDDFCMQGFNQIPDFFDHLNETCNLELYWPIVLPRGGEKPREVEDWLNGAAAWPMSVGEVFVNNSMKNHCSEAKFLEGI